MAAKIFRPPASTEFTAEQALNDALKDDLSDVLIVGYNQDALKDDMCGGSVYGQ